MQKICSKGGSCAPSLGCTCPSGEWLQQALHNMHTLAGGLPSTPQYLICVWPHLCCAATRFCDPVDWKCKSSCEPCCELLQLRLRCFLLYTLVPHQVLTNLCLLPLQARWAAPAETAAHVSQFCGLWYSSTSSWCGPTISGWNATEHNRHITAGPSATPSCDKSSGDHAQFTCKARAHACMRLQAGVRACLAAASKSWEVVNPVAAPRLSFCSRGRVPWVTIATVMRRPAQCGAPAAGGRPRARMSAMHLLVTNARCRSAPWAAHLCRASGSSPQACRCVGSSAAGSYVCDATSNTCVLPVCSSGGGNCRTGSSQTCRCTLTGHTCNSSGSCVVSFSRCGLPRAVSGQQSSLQRQPGHDCQHRICTPCMAVGQCPTRAFGILPLPTPGLHAYHCTAEYVSKQHQRR